MPTTIRVEEDVKRELDKLQGDFLAENGERLTHSQLLARLLRFARLNEEALLEGEADLLPTPEDIERLLAGLPDVRVRTNVRELDKDLYGERP